MNTSNKHSTVDTVKHRSTQSRHSPPPPILLNPSLSSNHMISMLLAAAIKIRILVLLVFSQHTIELTYLPPFSPSPSHPLPFLLLLLLLLLVNHPYSEHALHPPAVQAAELDEDGQPPGSPAGAVRKPLLTIHTHVPPTQSKRSTETLSHIRGTAPLPLHSPAKRSINTPGTPGASLTTHLQSLQSSKTPFASVSPHSPASVIAPQPPSRRKGHMEAIETRMTDLVDQVCRLHRDVNHTEQHRYERALNMAEREADVLAHRLVYPQSMSP